MKKTMKLMSIVIIVAMLCMISSNVFASMLQPGEITPSYNNSATSELTGIAGRVMGLIRNIAVIAGVILLAIIGIKFMLGSPEEKSEYKKSLVPLVIGIIIVMAATQIMTMIFGFFNA